MESIDNRKAAIKKLRLLAYNGKSDINTFRTKLDKAYKTVFLPNRVDCSDYKYGNVSCDVLAPEIYASNRVMLYIHGGSFVGGSRDSYRAFCSSLASKCFCRVVLPEYKLPPAYPYPAANEDIQTVFRSLFTEEQIACSLDSEKGQKPVMPEFIIAADGAGAAIACSLIFNLRERYRNCIKTLILFSPWLDVSGNSKIISSKKMSDEVISGEILRKSTSIYTYESNIANPFVSPLLASDEYLKNFPKTVIQYGGNEIMKDDYKAFEKRLRYLGSKCLLDEWENMPFMFQMVGEYLHSSHLALDKIGKIVTEVPSGDEQVEIQNIPRLELGLRSEA